MDDDQVKDHFRRQTADYVGLMERLIPQYVAQQQFLCELIPFDRNSPIRILDLGAGPGVLTEQALQIFPHASAVAFDLTREMLEVCEQRLASLKGRFEVRQGDFKTDPLGENYDVILAGLTLHHVEDEQRRKIFSKLLAALRRGGIFLAREIVTDEDPFVTEWHYALWRSFIRSKGEDDAYWYGKHRQKDHPAPVERQLAWLREAGFEHPACHWRYWNFAIISARSPSGN